MDHIVSSLLSLLRCPFCNGRVEIGKGLPAACEPSYGILLCACSRFPVLSGIPILQRGIIGSAGETAEDVLSMIETGRCREALLAVLLPAPPPSPSLAPAWIRTLPTFRGMWRLKDSRHRSNVRRWREESAAWLLDRPPLTTAWDLFEFYCSRSGSGTKDGNYFPYRFGIPRHLVGLSFLSTIERPRRPLLDLACGFGHLTRGMSDRAAGQAVIGADHVFFCLYVAKHWIAPNAAYVCCSAETALPFETGAFSAVLCSDSFQYFAHKASCMREMQRVANGGGAVMVVSTRNATVSHLYPCAPLSPQGYLDLVDRWPARVVPNTTVLRRYLQRQGPALSHQVEDETFDRDPYLNLIASDEPDYFRDYGRFSDWPHAAGPLTINPLYVKAGIGDGGSTSLLRTFPSTYFERENIECRDYLPDRVEISEDSLKALHEQKRTPDVERLIESFVVLGIPEGYYDGQLTTDIAQPPFDTQTLQAAHPSGTHDADAPADGLDDHIWSIGIYEGTSPYDLKPSSLVHNPILTAADVRDAPAKFVADPFMIITQNASYLFFELLNMASGRGEIGLATSLDHGCTWKYKHIVLAEPFHLSYPYVFEWQHQYFMIPETRAVNSVRLYRAIQFPHRWTFVTTLLSGCRFADASPVYYGGRWWMFTETSAEGACDILRLYYADNLFGPWREHPSSPIVTGDPHIARPAGRVLAWPDRIVRFTQDCAPRYGLQVHAFEVVELTITRYAERLIGERSLLSGSGTGWNANGMHHLDAHRVDSNRWLACVDGW